MTEELWWERKKYWEERYAKQGLRTVGASSLSPEGFRDVSQRSISLMRQWAEPVFGGGRVLDFGCGFGRMTKELCGFASSVYGIDLALWPIIEAEKYCNSSTSVGATFMSYDGEKVPFGPGYFDGVLSWTVIQHLPPEKIEGICDQLQEVVRPGGNILLYENVSIWNQDKPHIWFRDVQAYRRLFGGCRLVDHALIEGMDGNSEMHAVILLERK